MLIEILNFILSYVAIFIGIIIQSVFLLLPIEFKNWDDDTLNVMTYVSLQVFVGGVLFVISPWFFEAKQLSSFTLIGFFGVILILAVARAIILIPLEFTHAVKEQLYISKKINFFEFFYSKRMLELGEIPFDMPDGELRYNAFRERLARSRAEDNESIMEELINLENESH
ncbi:hypothetical protein [Fluviispira multicolorata]|uniref:Uncharacterized protein n=1 Tax=Fluviispira multicolorata TaxID=2654512 RepID=A0A833N5C7_9BACT|nr:hypothetical protein [Fluviispira multicolorata]KAB8027386.1 hypothetical protein GCL57_14410 [Fluviispira multicolorata]